MNDPRLAFVAHAAFCEKCVTLMAPRERREALRFGRTGPLTASDLPPGTRVKRGDGKVGSVSGNDGENVLVMIEEAPGQTVGCTYSPAALQLEGESSFSHRFNCAEGRLLAERAEHVGRISFEPHGTGYVVKFELIDQLCFELRRVGALSKAPSVSSSMVLRAAIEYLRGCR